MNRVVVCAFVFAMLLSSVASAEINLKMFTFQIDRMQIGAGQNLTITYVVKNEGTTESPGTVMRVYYSFDQTIATNDTVLADVNIAPLSPNEMTDSAELTVTIPDDASPGSHYVGAIVDPDKLVAESNRNDNSNKASFTVMPPADLTLSLNSIEPESQQFGGPVKVAFRVMKSGEAPVGPFKVRLYFSEDFNITTDDTPIDYEYEASLDLNIMLDDEQIVDVLLPSTATIGNHFVGAIVDPDDEIFEGTGVDPDPEANNGRAVPIEITEAICFEIPASDLSVCGGHGTCVGPDKCECQENWGGEQCDTPLLADDNITDEGSQPDVVVAQDTTEPDVGQADAGVETAVPDHGPGVDTAAADATADATSVEEDTDSDHGGCGQSGGSGLPAAVMLMVAAACFAFRRKFV